MIPLHYPSYLEISIYLHVLNISCVLSLYGAVIIVYKYSCSAGPLRCFEVFYKKKKLLYPKTVEVKYLLNSFLTVSSFAGRPLTVDSPPSLIHWTETNVVECVGDGWPPAGDPSIKPSCVLIERKRYSIEESIKTCLFLHLSQLKTSYGRK